MQGIRIVFRLFIVAALCVLVSASGCKLFFKYILMYELTGSAIVDTVYYFDALGHEVTEVVTPPWSYEYGTNDEDLSVRIRVATTQAGSGLVIIYLNDEQKASAMTSNLAAYGLSLGPYTIADLEQL